MPIYRVSTVEDQGTYFTANNGATGIASAAAPTSYSDTAPFAVITNTQGAGQSAKQMYLDWIRFYETAAGTGATGGTLKMQLDTTVATGGTLLVPKATRGDDGATTVAAIRLQPTGIAATGAVRVIVGNQNIIPTQTTPLAVNTEVFLKMAGADGFQSTQVNGTAVTALYSRNVYHLPPIVLSPGWALSIQVILLNQSAASSWAFEFGWDEF